VRERLPVVCHVWPGITPWNVWELPYDVWVDFAHAADEWIKERTKET
jgi:hypothetical protein